MQIITANGVYFRNLIKILITPFDHNTISKREFNMIDKNEMEILRRIKYRSKYKN